MKPNNAYSFYVHPLGDFGIGQGADGFAINTNHLKDIKIFYDLVVKNNKDLIKQDDLWISFYLYFLKKNKILSLQEHLKRNNKGEPSLIYKKHTLVSGLIESYGSNLKEAIIKRDQVAIKCFKYMQEKTKGLSF